MVHMRLVSSLLLSSDLDTTAVCVMPGYEGLVRGPVRWAMSSDKVSVPANYNVLEVQHRPIA